MSLSISTLIDLKHLMSLPHYSSFFCRTTVKSIQDDLQQALDNFDKPPVGVYTKFSDQWPPNRSTFIARLSNGKWGKFFRPQTHKDVTQEEADKQFVEMIRVYGMIDWMIPEKIND